jgi:hypothetical protein
VNAQQRERVVRDQLWMDDDPAAAIAARWPDIDADEHARLTALAAQIVRDELGEVDPPAPIGDAATRAHELLLATGLFEELGYGQLAARSRMVARDALELQDQLDAERSARRAMQADRDRLRELLISRTGEPRLHPPRAEPDLRDEPQPDERAELEQRLRDADVSFGDGIPLEELRELVELTGADA